MSGMAGKEDGNKRGARDKRQILLMSVAWWRKWRTLHSPTCPAGICWTQLLDFVCVTRAKLAYLVWEESGRVRWNLAYSDRVCRFRPGFSSGLVHRTPPTGLSPIYSIGLSPWTPPDSVHGLHWTQSD